MHIAVILIGITALALDCLLMILLIWVLRKSARTENTLIQFSNETHQDFRNTFRQLEDLQFLYYGLSPRLPLPRTRGWAASPDFLRVIAEHIADRRPATILELGSGVSTIICAYVLEKIGSGKVYALDHDEKYLGATLRQVRDHGLGTYAALIHAPLVPNRVSRSPWYDLAGLPDINVDMLIIDGPPASTTPLARYPAIPLLLGKLTENAVIILDDSARSGEQECIRRWQQEHSELRAEHIACEKGCTVLTFNP